MRHRGLIVLESDEALGRTLARLMRSYGYDVHLFNKCAEVRQASERASLGIFELELPDCNGVELARELLETARIQRAVFFTSSLDATLQERASAYGLVVAKARGLAVLRIAIESQFNDLAGIAEKKRNDQAN